MRFLTRGDIRVKKLLREILGMHKFDNDGRFFEGLFEIRI